VLGNQIPISKPTQTDQRVGRSQPFVTTSVRQLKRLRDKLNFPDSASMQLYVKTSLSFAMSINLLFGKSHASQRSCDGDVGPENTFSYSVRKTLEERT
jgi:hypothetical protein